MAGWPELVGSYEINIAKFYKRRVVDNRSDRSYTHYAKMVLVTLDHDTALAMLADTRTRYPEPEWDVTMISWTRPIGTQVEPEEATDA